MFVLIVFALVWQTLFVCVVLAMVCDVFGVFAFVGRSCIFVVRFDVFWFWLLFVVCVICVFVTMCLVC